MQTAPENLFRGNGRALLKFFLATAGLLPALVAFFLFQSYQQSIDGGKADGGNLAWVLEEQLNSDLNRLDGDLQQIAGNIGPDELNPAHAARYRAKWTQYLNALNINFPNVGNYYIVDRNGQQLYASGTYKPVNLADRAHFKTLASDPAVTIVYSEVVISKTTQRPSIAIARPLRAPDGTFLGLVSVLVNLDHIQQEFAAIKIGPKATIGLRRVETNQMVVRQPPRTAELNKATDSPIWRRVQAGERIGFARFESPVDHELRLWSFRALDSHPFVVSVGLANDDVLAEWRQRCLASVLATLAVLAMLGGLLWRIWQADLRRIRLARELEAAHLRAHNANLAKSQFLANMSHEIRTPMNAILGLLALLQHTPLSQRQRDYASKTEGAAKSLLEILNDILDFTKVEAGKMTLENTAFSLEGLLRKLSVVLSANVDSKNIEVLFDIDPQLPERVCGDAMRLQQVLINLGGNAIKFTPKGQVVLTLRKVAESADAVRIHFEVKDSGIGIAPEHQSTIFSDFAQAEGSTTRRFGGTGLGLTISQKLIGLMGGEIVVHSQLGQGSTFSFELAMQRAPEDAVASTAAPATGVQPAAIKALVIDDNPLAAALSVAMLKSLGWSAESAGSGRDALARIAAAHRDANTPFPFDAIYIDWQMPGMDGWDTTQAIRTLAQKFREAHPVITMVTAHNREMLEHRTSVEQDQLNGFLVKPVTASMLREAYHDCVPGAASANGLQTAQTLRKRLQGMRLLVVEDNLINQQVAEELLSSEGALVSLAPNGRAGVEAVQAAVPPFDAVLMDIQMPVLDGYQATQVIRSELGLTQLPIIAMTANAMASDREACLAAGMNDHIGKPFDMGRLIAVLLSATRQAAAPDALVHAPAIAPEPSSAAAAEPPVALELSAALARMAGMRSLYVRTAGDFANSLSDLPQTLQQQIRGGQWPEACMRLHTLKGNAATLGAMALSTAAAQLEKRLKTAPVTELSTNLPALLREVSALEALCISTRHQLAEAMVALSEAPGPAAVTVAEPITQARRASLRQEIVRLERLLADSNMEALQRFAGMREAAAGLPSGTVKQLEAALDALDLPRARTLCQTLLAEELAATSL